jgi:hypothetical protein
MRHPNGNTRIGAKVIVTLWATAFAVLIVITLTATNVAAQPCLADHLECYHVGPDQFNNRNLLSLASEQFGVEPNCAVIGGAVEFCVPVCKTVTTSRPPAGTGFEGTALTDDELCYHLNCRTNNAPRTLVVEDQFAQRTIGLGPADFICAAAEKVTPPPACGFTPPAAMGAGQCGGACPAGDVCQFTPPQPPSSAGVPPTPASCSCHPTEVACGSTSPTAAPMCGGACPTNPASGAEQLCRQLGKSCECTPF